MLGRKVTLVNRICVTWLKRLMQTGTPTVSRTYWLVSAHFERGLGSAAAATTH
jgi:hypothetical protein